MIMVNPKNKFFSQRYFELTSVDSALILGLDELYLDTYMKILFSF